MIKTLSILSGFVMTILFLVDPIVANYGYNMLRVPLQTDEGDNIRKRLTLTINEYKSLKFHKILHKVHFDKRLILLLNDDMVRVQNAARIIFERLSPFMDSYKDSIESSLRKNDFSQVVTQLPEIVEVFSEKIDTELQKQVQMKNVQDDAVYYLRFLIISEIRRVYMDLRDDEKRIRECLQIYDALLSWVYRLSKGLPTLLDSYTADPDLAIYWNTEQSGKYYDARLEELRGMKRTLDALLSAL